MRSRLGHVIRAASPLASMRHRRSNVGAGAKSAKFTVDGLCATIQPPIHQVSQQHADADSREAEAAGRGGKPPASRRPVVRAVAAGSRSNGKINHSASTSVRLNGSLGLTLGSFFHCGYLFMALRTKS